MCDQKVFPTLSSVFENIGNAKMMLVDVRKCDWTSGLSMGAIIETGLLGQAEYRYLICVRARLISLFSRCNVYVCTFYGISKI